MRNFEVQRDKEFRLHVCADHPRAKSQSTKRDVKQDWERLYRAAIIESDGSRTQKQLGVPYTTVSAHSRHIQQSCQLDDIERRQACQRDEIKKG